MIENCEKTLRMYMRELGLTALTRERVKPLTLEEDDSDGECTALRLLRGENHAARPLRVN